jgi:hypothetical protein
MRRRLPVALALPLVVGLLGLSAGAAGAAPATPPGRAIGDAATGLAVVRLLPSGTQPAVQAGFGLASAQANSEASIAFEKAVAEAAPGGVLVQGNGPQAPGTLTQTAPPDNPQAATGGFNLPSTPLDALVKGGVLDGSVHAQWSDTAGPCVGTISDAGTEVGSLGLLNAIPALPNVMDLAGILHAPGLDANGNQAVVDSIKKLAGPLSTLGGVLGGGHNAGSLLSLPNTMSVRATVRLVDIPGSANKAVQAVSTMQVAALKLLAGTPFELSVNVVSQPTLTVTSTGDSKTSTVKYTAPVLEVVQGGKSLGRLDAANPKLDIPIGIPLPGAQGGLPIIGDLLGNGQALTDAVSKGLQKLDLGVIRLSIAELNQTSQPMTTPFAGFHIGATARMLDLQVLPTAALGLPNLPSALAQVSLGEQVANAFAPTGGVVCGLPAGLPNQPPPPAPQGKAPMHLAYTTAQYATIPMFWAGTAMLLFGVVLLAAFPYRRPEPEPTPVPPTPSPRPRNNG